MKGQHFIVLRKLFVAKDAGWVVKQEVSLKRYLPIAPKLFCMAAICFFSFRSLQKNFHLNATIVRFLRIVDLEFLFEYHIVLVTSYTYM